MKPAILLLIVMFFSVNCATIGTVCETNDDGTLVNEECIVVQNSFYQSLSNVINAIGNFVVNEIEDEDEDEEVEEEKNKNGT